tara:strand:- start:141 stop:287 length:147 start_codon:yes stop_codon:yes gene_type:complete
VGEKGLVIGKGGDVERGVLGDLVFGVGATEFDPAGEVEQGERGAAEQG